MKKLKYRNNNYNNNQIYSINYKFDSISPAGKCSGTALDLIKRYNELAKEAHGNGNYVEAEVFRQYAEHYRKIVTEINERKNSHFGNRDNDNASVENNAQTNDTVAEEAPVANETAPHAEEVSTTAAAAPVAEESTLVETKPKKSFTVIEVSDAAPKAKRHYKPRVKKDHTELADAQ
jgi:hypothetical protein